MSVWWQWALLVQSLSPSVAYVGGARQVDEAGGAEAKDLDERGEQRRGQQPAIAHGDRLRRGRALRYVWISICTDGGNSGHGKKFCSYSSSKFFIRIATKIG